MATSLAFSKKVFTWSCITSWSKSHSYLLTYSRGHKCTFVLSQAESVLNLAVTLEAAKPSATEKLILSLFILYWTSLPLRSSSLLLLLQNLDWLLLMQYGNISNWWISLMLLPVLFLVWGAPRTPKTFPVLLLFQVFLYIDWKYPDKMFAPNKCLLALYLFEEDFNKWSAPHYGSGIVLPLQSDRQTIGRCSSF